MNQIIKPIARLSCTALLLSVCISSSLQAKDAGFDLETLSKFGTRKYKMTWTDRSSGSPVEHERGTMILSATVTDNAVLLKNVTRTYSPDGKRFIEYNASCSCSPDKALSLRRMNGKVLRSDGVVLHEVHTVIEKDKITHTCISDGTTTKTQDEWAEGTILDLAVFFLVPQLPQKNGQSVSIENIMPAPTDTIRKPESHIITCTGVDRQLSPGGATLTKFVNTTKGEKEGVTYWVDSKGLLRRVLLNAENRLDLIIEEKGSED